MTAGEAVQRLNACFDAQARLVPFSGVVLMERGGERFVRTAGFADAERRVPIRRDHKFQLASVTKVVTRAAIGRLADQGRISLDAPVGSYVRGLPDAMAAVTIDQLLQHRAGVVSLTQLDDDGPDYQQLMSARRASDVLSVLTRHPLEFQPGARRQYSNGGFMLLGIVIEAVTGQTYGDAVAEHVYRPLGMGASGLYADGDTALPLTTQDLPAGSEPHIYAYHDRMGLPSGNTVSTADDLMTLGRALMGAGFLSSDIRQRLFPADGDSPFPIFQDGASAGVQTAFVMTDPPGWRMVLLSNRDAPAGERMGMTLLRAAGMLGGPPVCEPSS